jgi:hypothetical protein
VNWVPSRYKSKTSPLISVCAVLEISEVQPCGWRQYSYLQITAQHDEDDDDDDDNDKGL